MSGGTKNLVIAGLIAFIGYFAIFHEKKVPETEVVTVTTVDTVVDTVFVEVEPDTILVDRWLKPEPTEVIPSSTGEDLKVYKGEYPVDSTLTVLYEVHTRGLIEGMNFGAIKNYPPQEVIEKTITVTNETTITEYVDYSGIYLSFAASTNKSLFVGLTYQKGVKQFGLAYDPLTKNIMADFKFRLIKFRRRG